MKDKVYNQNLQQATTDNLKQVQGIRGVDSDAHFSIQGIEHPQATLVGNLVPPMEQIDLLPPVVVVTYPVVSSFVGNAFFQTPNSIIAEFDEIVLNATVLYNWQLSAGAHMGGLTIDSVAALSPSATGGSRVQINFSGVMADSGFLMLEVNPKGTQTPIMDSNRNVMPTEVLTWFADLTQPWLETVQPSPQYHTISTDTFSWDFQLTFSEFLPPNPTSWEDASHYSFKLCKYANGELVGELPVPVVNVYSLIEDQGEFGPQDGSLQIQVETEDPFANMTDNEGGQWTKLKLEIQNPQTILDRAGNPMQPVQINLEWNVNYISNDITAPTATLLEPSDMCARMPTTFYHDGQFVGGAYAVVGFDEAVVDGDTLGNWSVNADSGFAVTGVQRLDAGALASYGVEDGYRLTLAAGGQEATEGHMQVTVNLSDAAGNPVSSTPLSKNIDPYFPVVASGPGSVDSLVHGHDQSGPHEVDVPFTRSVKRMSGADMETFWGVGTEMVVFKYDDAGYYALDETKHLKVTGVSEITNSYGHILGHRLAVAFLNADGSVVADGTDSYQAYIVPTLPADLSGADTSTSPKMPYGFTVEQVTDHAKGPETTCGGWGNPLSASLTGDATTFSADWHDRIVVAIQNTREITAPTLVSVSPPDASTIDPDTNTITLTFSEQLAGYGYLSVTSNGQPVYDVSGSVVGDSIVLTNASDWAPGESVAVVLTHVEDVEGDVNPAEVRLDYTVASYDTAISLDNITKIGDGTVDVAVTLGGDADGWAIQTVYRDGVLVYENATPWDTPNPPSPNTINHGGFTESGTYTVTVVSVRGTQVAGQASLDVAFDYSAVAYSDVVYGWSLHESGAYLWQPEVIRWFWGLGADVPTLDLSVVKGGVEHFSATFEPKGWDELPQYHSLAEGQTHAQCTYGQMPATVDDILTPGTWICSISSSDISLTVGSSVSITMSSPTLFQAGKNVYKLAPAGFDTEGDSSGVPGVTMTVALPDGQNVAVNAHRSHNTPQGWLYRFGPYEWPLGSHIGDFDWAGQVEREGFVYADHSHENLQVVQAGDAIQASFTEPAATAGFVESAQFSIKYTTEGVDHEVLVDMVLDNGVWTGTSSSLGLQDGLELAVKVISRDETGVASFGGTGDVAAWEELVDITAVVETQYALTTGGWSYQPDSSYATQVESGALVESVQAESNSTNGVYTATFTNDGGDTVAPTVRWFAVASYTGVELGSGLSMNMGTNQELVEIRPEDIGMVAEHERIFELEYEGIADGEVVVPRVQHGLVVLDRLAPFYENANTLGGAVIGRNFMLDLSVSDASTGAWSTVDQMTTVNMWKFMDANHQSYDPSANKLVVSYDSSVSDISIPANSFDDPSNCLHSVAGYNDAASFYADLTPGTNKADGLYAGSSFSVAGATFSIGLADPRTFKGWDKWKDALGWEKAKATKVLNDLLLRNPLVADTYGNTYDDGGWPWLFVRHIPHDHPLLVDVHLTAIPEYTGEEVWTETGRFSGVQPWAATTPSESKEVVLGTAGDLRVDPYYESLLEQNGITDTTPLVNAYRHIEDGNLPLWIHVGVTQQTLRFALELHYAQPVGSGDMEVKLHGDHLSFVAATPPDNASGTPGKLFGVPYPLKVLYTKNETLFDPATQSVGEDWLYWRNLHKRGGAPEEWFYAEGADQSALPVDTVWLDRGDVVPEQVGHMIRVGFALEPWLEDKLTVQQIPGTELWGIPLTLEVGLKPYTRPNGDNLTTGSDFVSFWLALGDEASMNINPEGLKFAEEAEVNNGPFFGPIGGHKAGNGDLGRLVLFQGQSTDVNSVQDGIFVVRLDNV